MAVVTLTFTQLGEELIDGIPEFVQITSSEPALIFYSLDGSLPTVFSQQYESPIQMPTDVGSVTLSAVGYTEDGYGNLVPGPVLSEEYSVDPEIGLRVRNAFFEGVTYISPGGSDIPFWYDYQGEVAVAIDIPAEELQSQLKLSDRDAQGNMISTGVFGDTSRTPWLDTTTTRDDPYKAYDSPTGSSDGTFDPEALYIVVDGRNPRSLDDVKVINGPYMSLRNPEGNYGGIDFVSTDGSNYVSGSLARYMFNRDKGVIVFYYFDSNANRWIKSIQNLPEFDTSKLSYSIMTNPVVFKWFTFGRHQGV